MEFLKKLFKKYKIDVLKLIIFDKMTIFKKKFTVKQWFKDGLESIFWNMLGNLLPIYVMIFISISDAGFNMDSIYKSIHQPFTFLILSGTYITNAYYIVSKHREKNKIFPFIFAVALLFIGLLIKDKTILEDLSAGFYKEIIVVILFFTSFSFYVYYQFKIYYDAYNANYNNESKKEYDKLRTSFEINKDEILP